MAQPILPQWARIEKPVIGMVHMLPLPGSPKFDGDLRALRDSTLRDAEGLAMGGVNGLIIENFGDAPFYKERVPPHVVAQMTALAANLRRRNPDLPIGINVLRNDAISAMAIASAVGASFIRVNILCGARVTDQGLMQGVARELLRYRKEIDSTGIKIFADVNVKHSAALGSHHSGSGGYRLEDEVHDTIDRGLADAVIVSGTGTGKSAEMDELMTVKAAAGDTPVILGSGVNAENMQSFATHADGFIVGSGVKKDGVVTNAVDPRRVEKLMMIQKHMTLSHSGGTGE